MQVSKISFQGDLRHAKEQGNKILIGDNVYKKGKEYALFLDRFDYNKELNEEMMGPEPFYAKPQVVKLLGMAVSFFDQKRNESVVFKTQDKKILVIWPKYTSYNSEIIKVDVNGQTNHAYSPFDSKFELCNADEVQRRMAEHNKAAEECANILNELA